MAASRLIVILVQSNTDQKLSLIAYIFRINVWIQSSANVSRVTALIRHQPTKDTQKLIFNITRVTIDLEPKIRTD